MPEAAIQLNDVILFNNGINNNALTTGTLRLLANEPEPELEPAPNTDIVIWDLNPAVHDNHARMSNHEFERGFRTHHNHNGFAWDDDPIDRIIGFVCDCNNTPQSWYAPLTFIHQAFSSEFKELINRARSERRNTTNNIAVRRQKNREKQKNKNLAETRARILLRSNLNREQRRQFDHLKSFRVFDPSGREYWIECRPHTNVTLVDGRRKLAKYCAVFEEHSIPVFDLMLAQKLLLENVPHLFFEKANRHNLISDPEEIANLPGSSNDSIGIIGTANAINEFIFIGGGNNNVICNVSATTAYTINAAATAL